MQVSLIKPNYPVYFTSLKRPLMTVNKADVFERINSDADNYYSKLEKSMDIVTPQDVVNKAQKVSKATGVSIDDVYKTMGLLSQYSSYKSLKFIEDTFKQRNKSAITSLHAFKSEGFPICLTDVLAYVGNKNLNVYNSAKNGKKVVIVDSVLLKFLNKSNKQEDVLDFINYSNSKLLYFENFENGYNFLNQEKSFEDFTIDVIEKAKKYQKYNNKTLEYNVKYVLNGENYKNMKKLSVDIDVVRQDNIATPEKIADNLNPIMPSKEEFKSELSKISKRKIGPQKEILSFLDKNMEVITPQKYALYMKKIHEKLQSYLDERGKTMDDVYFLVPERSKSFILANYIYNKVNNIDNSKNIFLSSDYDRSKMQMRNLPKNAVAVIVDDCIISGLSMKSDVIPYEELASNLAKDIDIVFAPMVSKKSGARDLEAVSRINNRHDKVICAKQLPDVCDDFDYLALEYDSVNNSYMVSSVIFPYMGPDFNCDELIPIYQKFFYSPNAQKGTAKELGL